MSDKLRYAVFMGLAFTIIEDAGSVDQARKMALERVGLDMKPWLARDWIIRIATRKDLEMYAAHADGYRPSQPTAKTAPKPGKVPKKSVQERLL